MAMLPFGQEGREMGLCQVFFFLRDQMSGREDGRGIAFGLAAIWKE